MNNILYIGNKLSNSNTNITFIEILGKQLELEKFNVIYSSNKENKLNRLFDMIFATISNRKIINHVLIDTYSTFGFIYALIISQLCRMFSLKYIPILHGGNLPNRLKNNPRLCNIIFNNAHINVAPSLYLFDTFMKFGYKKTVHIPNFININNYSFDEKLIEMPKLLWVRSFSEIYNPKMAINVFAKILQEYPESELCMVGPNETETFLECKNLAENLKININFTGKLPKEAWISLSKNYNIFINTTHIDNTPLSLIEAMALGLSIVSTNVGGISNLITDNKTGLLVDDNDVDAMTKAIITLKNDSVLNHNLAINARKKVEKFDWEIVKKQWLEILN